jgi:predicted XRE-type DNA-binding protein
MNTEKPLYQKLSEYIAQNNLNGKEIAEIFSYSQAAMSQYLNGKSADSKLDVIVELFLKLKKLENSSIAVEEKEILEASNEILRLKCAKYEGEVSALKSILRDMQNKMILDSSELQKIIEESILNHISKASK